MKISAILFFIFALVSPTSAQKGGKQGVDTQEVKTWEAGQVVAVESKHYHGTKEEARIITSSLWL